ncbi:Uncharacterised protein [Mycobacteroides abscessus subsp. massiliense]|nr:Uncharacterised protein [Mycobacteroides abscessus subsp. massiliense]
MKVPRRAGDRFGHHDQPSAVQQRAPDLPHREIEGIRVELRPHLARLQRHPNLQGVEQLGDIALCYRHTLG